MIYQVMYCPHISDRPLSYYTGINYYMQVTLGLN